jgi:tRNA nucleotidyltransferase/poly(A) polymerase
MPAESLIPQAVEQLSPVLRGPRVWLVGGSVRDRILRRPSYDFDFVVDGDAVAFGRRLANEVGADYFELDPKRGTGRMLLSIGEGRRTLYDFARLRQDSIEGDLRGRDLTVNAMGVSLEAPTQLIDPTGGLEDLRQRVVRACSPEAIQDDPVRALRCVRIADELSARITSDTVRQVRGAAALLQRVSPERLRDEFFRILGLPRPSAALRQLDSLGLLTSVVPELEPLRGLAQPAAHAYDALSHTLAVVAGLERLLWTLDPEGADRGKDLAAGWVLQELGRFRQPLGAHLDHSLTFGRTRRQGLYLAALLHDVGKSTTFTYDSDGSIRFLGHEAVGAAMAVGTARRLALSLAETAELERLVADHMRPGWMEKEGGPSPRAVYRFFRLTQAAGVGIALLSLADLFGKHVPPVPEAAWSTRVEIVRILLGAWFEERRTRVDPEPLLNGEAVMRLVGIPSGPIVGRLLEDLREAQVEVSVRTVEEAEAFLRNRYEEILARSDAGGGIDED